MSGKSFSKAPGAYVVISESAVPDPFRKGYDPEKLYVECSRCGSPILWEKGKAAKLVRDAGIDPLELDPSCVLLSDGCPGCSEGGAPFGVQVCRLTNSPSGSALVTQLGNA